jgi:ribonuclease VapC
MFVDASAIVAVLNGEPEGPRIERALVKADRVTVSPTVKFEAVLALAKAKEVRPGAPRAAAMARALDSVLAILLECRAEEIAITPDIGRLAVQASTNFGRGSGHRARLNFGDCFAYACAKARGESLLFVGQDFVHTDVLQA